MDQGWVNAPPAVEEPGFERHLDAIGRALPIENPPGHQAGRGPWNGNRRIRLGP
jgi:hypothetical protein